MNHLNNDTLDADVQQIIGALGPYKESHTQAEIDVQRQNRFSIRVRIIDPDFRGIEWDQREPEVWKLLEPLPEDVFTCITMLLLLTPEETAKSLANFEFENPVPSQL